MLVKRLCYLVATVFLIASVGCASSQLTQVVHPDGEPAPNPYYRLETIDPKQPMRVSFYYVVIKRVQDLDGSHQPEKKFLRRRGEHYFLSKDLPQLNTVLRIINPWNKRYKVFYTLHAKYSSGGRMDLFSEVAHSDMKYREFYCSIPIVDGMTEATHEIELRNEDGNVLIRTGKFHYFIK